MRTSIVQGFTFHAAHRLDWHPGKCARTHGHTYRAEITLEGQLNENDIVIDFDELNETLTDRVISKLDHTDLNDQFDNPTAEAIATWIYQQVSAQYGGLLSVRLWETPESSAIISRD